VNPRRSPQWILATHPADQLTDVFRNRRPSASAPANFPGPEEAKGFSVLCDDALRSDIDQRRAPIRPHARQSSPEESI
jgi:hypothetical protein